jgi:hypothetical protein
MEAPVYVLYGTEAGGYAAPVALKTEDDRQLVSMDEDSGSDTDRICTHPCPFDLDGDGDLDFLIGNFSGGFLRVMNVGTKTAPAFKGRPEFVKNIQGEPLRLHEGNHSAPILVDWNGDGDVDLLSGSGRSGVQIADGSKSKDGAIQFGAFRVLIKAPSSSSRGVRPAGTPAGLGSSWRIAVVDYNADGKLDVIVGNSVRLVRARPGETVEHAMAEMVKWTKGAKAVSDAVRKAYQEAEAAEGAEAERASQARIKQAGAALEAHYEKRKAFLDEASLGHVWVYLRK